MIWPESKLITHLASQSCRPHRHDHQRISSCLVSDAARWIARASSHLERVHDREIHSISELLPYNLHSVDIERTLQLRLALRAKPNSRR